VRIKKCHSWILSGRNIIKIKHLLKGGGKLFAIVLLMSLLRIVYPFRRLYHELRCSKASFTMRKWHGCLGESASGAERRQFYIKQ